MNRSRFLIAHGADPVAWAKRYGIEPGTAPCYFCRVELKTTLPFSVGKLRGLVSPPCKCGNENTPYCVVAADGGDVLAAFPQPKPRKKRAKRRKLRLVK